MLVPDPDSSNNGGRTNQASPVLYILLPILIVLSTLLFMLLAFLVGLIVLKKKSRVR